MRHFTITLVAALGLLSAADAMAARSETHIIHSATLSDLKAVVRLPDTPANSSLSVLMANGPDDGFARGYSAQKPPTLRAGGTMLNHTWVETGQVTSFAILPLSVAFNAAEVFPL